MRLRLKSNVDFRFIIRKPIQTKVSKRVSFKIEKRVFDPNTKSVLESKLAQLPKEKQHSLDCINKRFRTKSLSFEAALSEVRSIVDKLYEEKRLFTDGCLNSTNAKILKEYLEARYSRARRSKLVDYNTARLEAVRAVEMLGDLSILSADPEQIQDRIDESSNGNTNRQRRMIFKMRAILSWLRPETRWKDLLVPWREEFAYVKYLTETEFKSVLEKLPTERHKVLAEVCFHLGCRVGEAFALGLSDFRESRLSVLICKQVRRRDHAHRKIAHQTKNKKRREAIIFPEGVPAFKRWIEIKDEFSTHERGRLAKVMNEICREVFPQDETKHLRWHDLRHSYAIRLLDRQLSIEDLADMIGDSVVVAKKFYVGFVVSDARMERIRMKVTAPVQNSP